MNYTDSPVRPRVVAVIPARYNSTRLEGKPLALIAGRPMILHVLERARSARGVGRVIAAADDRRVFEAVGAGGFEAVMTSAEHASGSDRIAEVAAALADADIIVNVQGDEPLIAPETIERAVEALVSDERASVATTSEAVGSAAEVLSPDVVKVVTDERGYALYFSRSPIPYPREAVRRQGSLERALEQDAALLSGFRKHTGLYVYRRAFLLEYSSWPQTSLERAESLEQLRMLEHGARIRVVEAAAPSVGVDTPEDLERVRAIIEGKFQV
ncbi:MAG TPA: 3-deoxy-manno-octulosonate cytidylyltransferase [Pyrinomonadaceae bacterium]